MPELHVEPQVLADAGRSLAAQRSVLTDVAGALAPALGTIASALPGSRTAAAAGQTASGLTAAARSAVAELAVLAAALTAAAREYAAVEHRIGTGFGRWPA
jgi:hypothetical protein